MAGFEKPEEQNPAQDFMQERPEVEAQPMPAQQDFMQERPMVQTPVEQQPPVQQPPHTYQQPPVQQPPHTYQQPPVQQPPYTYQQPPYTQQGYRAPYYTPQEDLGYLHRKKQETPARGQGVLGRLMGIFGMISSIVLMSAMMILCANFLGENVSAFLKVFEDQVVLLFMGVAEGLILSLLGVFLSRSAAKKGNTGTAAGKRMGLVGLVLSAINLADLILCLIVFLM